jgi:PAS domain-containing protein
MPDRASAQYQYLDDSNARFMKATGAHTRQSRTIFQNGADKVLRKSEARYRRLFETSQDGILILDAETGTITDANPTSRHPEIRC